MRKIRIGFEGDNMVERLVFVLPEIADSQTAVLMMGGAYANVVTLEKNADGRYFVDLTAEMVGTDGEVEAYVRIDGSSGEVWHSGIMRLVTGELPDVEIEIEQRFPTAVETMLTEMAAHGVEMEAQSAAAESAAQRAEAAADRAENAGGGGSSGGGITNETDPTVPDWAKQPNKPTYTAEEVGALAADQLQPAVNDALAQAKASGEFDGADGQPGRDGADGYTPVKGVDYFDGQDGAPGKDGYTPVKGVDYFDGQPGKDGAPGVDGKDGYTPVKGVDYFDGADGQPGKDGEKGETGADGKDYSFDPTVYGLPILYLTGDTTGMTKENEVTLAYSCVDAAETQRRGSCTLKWQGSSSLAYAKKNYTIKLDAAVEMATGWGAQKKYCLKANFIDHSHARNVVCAKLWGEVVKSRSSANSTLNALPNAGAVDGFPCIIMLNDEFHGLYTWNIPKDPWMFGMGNGEKEAILCADVPKNDGAVGFHKLADFVNDFELEYSSDGESEWVLDSINTLIGEVMNSDGTNLNKIGNYLDWESAIDWYIFTVLITGLDNTKKNYILATYDGVKWFFSAYDMDSTFGLYWDGAQFVPADRRPTFSTRGSIDSDKLMHLIWTYKRDQLRARYEALRGGVLSESNVMVKFSNFCAEIPAPVLIEDVKLWPDIPYSSVNNVSQILNNYRLRVMYADEWIKDTEGELDEPEQGSAYTNLVPTSIDMDGTIFNGTGYQDGKRLSSSGTIKDQDHSTLTGLIPCTTSDIVRLTGVVFAEYGAEGTDGIIGGNGIGQLYSYIALYKADKTLIESIACGPNLTNSDIIVSGWSYPTAQATDIITFDFRNYDSTLAYVRFNAVGSGADMIVTVNQEIV